MKKVLATTVIASMLTFAGLNAQAATVELQTLPDSLTPNLAGSMMFGVFLTDIGNLSNVDAFNFSLTVSGAEGLEIPKTLVQGPSQSGYIFSGNSFSFLVANPNSNLYEIAAGDVTSSGTGVGLSSDTLLATIQLNYPALPNGTAIYFSLDESQSFIVSDAASGGAMETLTLAGTTQVGSPVPLPGTAWLLGSAIAGLFGWRRKTSHA